MAPIISLEADARIMSPDPRGTTMKALAQVILRRDGTLDLKIGGEFYTMKGDDVDDIVKAVQRHNRHKEKRQNAKS